MSDDAVLLLSYFGGMAMGVPVSYGLMLWWEARKDKKREAGR